MVTDDAGIRERLEAELRDRYRIERELGGGGMSRVFVATDATLGRRVESRLDRMYKASTVPELEALLHEVETYRAQAPAVSPYSASYAPTPGPRRLLSIMSNTERTGRWVMPRQLTVRSLMSSVALDLREATLPAGVCEIDLLSLMANLEILVPPGVIVEDLALGVMANVENHAYDEGYVSPAAPRIRLTGTAVMANVEIRMAPPGLKFRKAWREAQRAWKRLRRG